MRSFLGQFWRDESGFTVVEYGVFAALMALVIILGASSSS
jgi:Flp pilus assembly pilin Flp